VTAGEAFWPGGKAGAKHRLEFGTFDKNGEEWMPLFPVIIQQGED
jgi:hypothetical protein